MDDEIRAVIDACARGERALAAYTVDELARGARALVAGAPPRYGEVGAWFASVMDAVADDVRRGDDDLATTAVVVLAYADAWLRLANEVKDYARVSRDPSCVRPLA